MAAYKKLVKWKRWHGSPAELAAIARHATELLREDPTEDGYPLRITVGLPGLETIYDSADEFEREVPLGDLNRINIIRIGVEDPRGDSSVVVTINRSSPAVSLDVLGTSRKDVEGIAEVLRGDINRGRRVHEAFFSATTLSVSLIAILGWIALIVLWKDAPWELSALGSLAGLLWVIPYLVLNRLVPTLELVPPGSQTRWEKSRKWLRRAAYSGAGTFVLAAIGVLAKAVFS